MIKRQWMAFSIGLVALAAFVLLGALILWFGDVRNSFRPRREYYVTFTNALGAEVKAPVRRAGIRIGEISKVVYDAQSGLVVLTIVLEGDNQLFDGDEPRLRATSLLAGDTYVDIETRPDKRGRPDQGDSLARFNCEIDVPKHRVIRVIRKVDVFKLNPTGCLLGSNGYSWIN